jgi:myo-inositol-hexaphosphate 3-phosphohydrolase
MYHYTNYHCAKELSMRQFSHLSRISLALSTLFLAGCTFVITPEAAQPNAAPETATGDAARRRVTGVDLLGVITVPNDTIAFDTPVGGLSAIAYNPDADAYYFLSDDRAATGPVRIYQAAIDLSDGMLDEGDLTWTGLVQLLDESGAPIAEGMIDPEGMVYTGDAFYVASEGNASAQPPLAPAIIEYTPAGEFVASLPLPEKFIPLADGSRGVRSNQAFESLTLSPDGRYLISGVENALVQDGPAATLEDESLSRLLKIDLTDHHVVAEPVYIVDVIPVAPEPASGDADNGLTDLVALDNNGTLLALERSYAEGVGNTIRLYVASTQGAMDTSTFERLAVDGDEGEVYEMDPPVAKQLLLDFAELGSELGVAPDNLEGLALGPQLADGRQTLLVVSDNNFNPSQTTQVWALALTIETVPTVLPVLETVGSVDEAEAPAGLLAGDSDDPAIWVHPTDPSQSLVLATLKDGGLVVFDLQGQVLSSIAPDEFGGRRFNNVDLLRGFDLEGTPVDLAVASDRANDTLAIFQIDPSTRTLTEITSPNIVESIFGEDDGEATAYGLATYIDPSDGAAYAFVTQADGNLVAQLLLTSDGEGGVTAEVVRTLELPLIGEEASESQSEGTVVDRDLGVFYIALEAGVVLKYDAAPTGSAEPIAELDASMLLADVEGLTIYYGEGEEGYLLISSQGDHTYAVYERDGENSYLGSFVVGDAGDIDQANESDGADVMSTPLLGYPDGLLVVQDGANDPQVVAVNEDEIENRSTNFKFISWTDVVNAMGW